MSTKYQIVRSASFNWVALLVGIAVSFFLSPFVVARLGNDAYGVWTFLNSTIAFMSLLDLGLRGTVTRFVARDYARGQHGDVRVVVSTIFWLRASLGGAALLAGVLGAGFVAGSIEMPAELRGDARLALMILAGSFAVTFATGVFGGVLAALQRFDLLSSVTIVQSLARAAGVVWVLSSGRGVLALALLDFSIVAVAGIAQRALVRYVYPQLKIEWRLPDRALLREIIGYSVYAYVINVCVQVIFYSDNVIVGATLTAAAVTFFAIGGGLVEYLRQIVSSLTIIFTPLASSIGASGGQAQLRQLLINGTRAALLTALPIAAGLLFRGHTFIGLWMGQEYAAISSQVLSILMLACVLNIANTTSSAIALGLGKHRIVAVWAASEAVSNLVLCIWLAHVFGLIGVAWGKVAPTVFIHLVLWPPYICKMVEMPISRYLWQGWLRPVLAVIPFAIACWLVDRVWSANNLFVFFLQMALIAPVYVVGAGLIFRSELVKQLHEESDKLPTFLRRGFVLMGRALSPRPR